MKNIKTWIANLAKNYWNLNWEAKIGIIFLIPPIIGVVEFLSVYISYFDFDYFSDEFAATPTIPLYLGLMAIAGAYLIKGNLKKKE